jgi:hypothetical protein
MLYTRLVCCAVRSKYEYLGNEINNLASPVLAQLRLYLVRL